MTEPLDPVDDEQGNDGFWSDDLIELMLDTDLDRRGFVHMGINSAGMRADAYNYNGPADRSTCSGCAPMGRTPTSPTTSVSSAPGSRPRWPRGAAPRPSGRSCPPFVRPWATSTLALQGDYGRMWF